jgi:hypothetical protein
MKQNIKNDLLKLLQMLHIVKSASGDILDELSEETVKGIDLAKPEQELAQVLVAQYPIFLGVSNITQQDVNFQTFMKNVIGEDVLAFVRALAERLEIIYPELQNVADGTATQEDWEELEWQNTFATKPQGLAKIREQALQDMKMELVEEGGWDAV